MEAKDLRLDNIVKADGYDAKYCLVKQILYNELTLEGPTGSITNEPLRLIRPIELTEDWLLRMGYIDDNNGYHIPGNLLGLTLSLRKDGRYLACYGDRVLGPVVDYVHQLQNLYFCLTGKEIEVKQPA